MKENVKKYIIYVIVALILVVIYFLVSIAAENKRENKSTSDKYLIIGESLIYQKNGNDWIQLKGFDEKISEKQFTVYDGNKKIENVILQYTSDKWYFFDEDYNDLNIDDFKLAFNTKDDITFGEFSSNFGSKSDLFASFLKDNGIADKEKNKLFGSYIDFDFNKDGNKERIYTASNVSLSSIPDKNISVLFMANENKISQMISEGGEDPFHIYSIVDIEGDGIYELIVTKGVIDMPFFDSCYQIYKLKNNKWELTIDCN